MRAHLLIFLTPLPLFGCFDRSAPDDAADTLRFAAIPRIISVHEALAGAHVPTLDPATMNVAEISKVIGSGAFCAFRYTSDGKPVVAWRRGTSSEEAPAAIKLNGQLVALGAVI